jgi:hypothetical protein
MECMGRWKRPYPRPLATVTAGGISSLFAAVGVGLATVAVGRFLAGDFGAAGGAGGGAAITALAAATALRATRCGLFVDADDGVMIRRFQDTASWPWTAVSAVESRPARLLTFGVSAGYETIWLVLANGEEVQTPLRSIAREDMSRWHQGDGVDWLDRGDFALALWTMQNLHRATDHPVAGHEDTGGVTDA